ncbi:MAG: lysylphosphatidylglycerol synthase transmembrane domain-containing protein, partial [Armatimonadota bacterium]
MKSAESELTTGGSADLGGIGAKGRKHKTAVKIVGSALLVLFVVTRVDVRDVMSAAAGARGWLVLLAGSLHLVGYLVSAVRWKILLAALGADVPLGTLVSSYLVGSFFNSFLPTTVGGDVVRIWDTSR